MAQVKKITSFYYPFLKIRLEIRGNTTQSLALVDTGFTGDLAIPGSFFDGKIGLPETSIEWELGDGRVIEAPIYLGSLEIIDFANLPISITVVGNEFVLGRGVINRFKITFDHGKRVTIEK